MTTTTEAKDFGRTQASLLVAAGIHDPDLIPCPSCKGQTSGIRFVNRGDEGCTIEPSRCSFCYGSGKVWSYNGAQYRVGRSLAEERIAKGYGILELGRLYGLKAGEWSDLEHGRRSLVDIDNVCQWLRDLPDRRRASASSGHRSTNA